MPTLRRRSPVTDEQVVEHYKQTLSAKQTAKALGIGGSTVETILTKYKVPRPGVQAWRDNRTLYRGCEAGMRVDYEAGATHEQLSWVDPNGYVSVSIQFDDPMASMRRSDGYVYEHRLVMARKLGRPLSRTETCHHIDGNPSNNHPDNLEVRHGRHGKHSAWVCRCCGSRDIEAVSLAEAAIEPAARIAMIEAEIAKLRASQDDPPAGNGASTSFFE